MNESDKTDTRLIPLTQGKFAIVDADDYEWLCAWKWYYHIGNGHKYGYAKRNSLACEGLGKTVFMHRAISRAPDGVDIDHFDCDGLNNRRSNLRPATDQQNCTNQRIRKDNTSGLKGVCYCKRDKVFTVHISVNRKIISLGGYKSLEEAGGMYITAALEYHGEFARF